jgi:hypothetical protein
MLLLRSFGFFDDSNNDSCHNEDCQGPPKDCNLEEPLSDDLDFVECVHVISYSGVHPPAAGWTGQRLFPVPERPAGMEPAQQVTEA